MISLTLDYPPSGNRYWRHVGSRVLVSREARAYREKVRLTNLRARPIPGDVLVVVRVYRPRRAGDLDNCLKVTLDALRGVAFVDDSQVVELRASRHDDKVRPRVEVEVSAVAA